MKAVVLLRLPLLKDLSKSGRAGNRHSNEKTRVSVRVCVCMQVCRGAAKIRNPMANKTYSHA